MPSSPQITYEQYYKNIIEDHSIYSIMNNHQNNTPYQYGSSSYPQNHQIEIFPICPEQNTPQFFINNLNSPNRIIKRVTGQYCIYQAFYFQLFKLMFQIENQEKDFLIIFKEIIFNPQLLSTTTNGAWSRARRESKRSEENSRVSQRSAHNKSNSQVSQSGIQGQQTKRQFHIHQKCLAQFIQIVVQNKLQHPSFQNYINLYPCVNQSMIIFLKKFIQNASQQQQMDSVQVILEYLSQIFEIQLVVFENCFKFQESDVFVYIQESAQKEDQIEVYLTFNQLDEQEEQEGLQQQRQDGIQNYYQMGGNNSNQMRNNNQNDIPSKISSKNSQNQKYQLTRQIVQKPQSFLNQKQSSSYKDNVITSQINQESHRKRLNQQLSSPSNFQNNLVAPTSQNYRNTRIISEMTSSRTKINDSQADLKRNEKKVGETNILSRSNQLPNRNNAQRTNSISSLPGETVTNFFAPGDKNTIQNSQLKQGQVSRPFNNILAKSNNQNGIGNFQKKTINFVNQIIVPHYEAHEISNSQSSSVIPFQKNQSHTQTYNQQQFLNSENQYALRTKKQRRSSLDPIIDRYNQEGFQNNNVTNTQNSFQITSQHQNNLSSYARLNTHNNRSSENDIYESKKFSQSKTDTIINMFGDMLKSTANLNNIDQSFNGVNAFSSSKNFNQQPERDNDNLYSHQKKGQQLGGGNYSVEKRPSLANKFGYGMATNIIGSTGQTVNSNLTQANMKKTKSDNQIVFEATKPTSVSGSFVFDKVQIKAQKSVSSHNKNMMMDSQQLRAIKTNNSVSYDSHIHDKQVLQQQIYANFKKQKPNYPLNPSQTLKQNLNRNSNTNSFDYEYKQQQELNIPMINVMTVRSYSSQDSQIEKNQHNNYWDDQLTLTNPNNSRKGTRTQRNQYESSRQNNQNINSPMKKSLDKEREFSVKSQQYRPFNNKNLITTTNQHSRAYTTDNDNAHQRQRQLNKQVRLKQQNQQDDFFFRPNLHNNNAKTINSMNSVNKNKASGLNYGLKTIDQVRASRETNKYQDGSKISSGQFKSSGGEIDSSKKFMKYQSVNSVQAWSSNHYTHSPSSYPRPQQKKPSIVQHLKSNQQQFMTKKKSLLLYKQKGSKELIDNDDSINNGTFYKQFTNTKILKLLREPHQTKVQILKNRFKGEHRAKVGNFMIASGKGNMNLD